MSFSRILLLLFSFNQSCGSQLTNILLAETPLEYQYSELLEVTRLLMVRVLAKKLRTYGFKPSQIGFENGVGAKGYHHSEIESTVRRYLDLFIPAISETTETPKTELTPEIDFVSIVSPDSLATGVYE